LTIQCPMLLSVNVGARALRRSKRFLLVGSCLLEEQPRIAKQYAKDRVCVHVCLETFHMNMAETKLACIVQLHQPTELLVLTVDGSPHCLQLHMLAEDLRRYFNVSMQVSHVVVEHGRPYNVSEAAVKTARHLHSVQALLDERASAKPL
jgi:hypothetical protein